MKVLRPLTISHYPALFNGGIKVFSIRLSIIVKTHLTISAVYSSDILKPYAGYNCIAADRCDMLDMLRIKAVVFCEACFYWYKY
jgi:hypothetical protein